MSVKTLDIIRSIFETKEQRLERQRLRLARTYNSIFLFNRKF